MLMKRILVLLFAVLAATAAMAATMAERSPFFQGHWWDPNRSGHGFEIFNASDQVMVIWYTYDNAGKPVWYTAQGPRTGLGETTWPLQKHQWSNGRISQSTTVGGLRLVVNHPESLDAVWHFGTSDAGTSALRPYLSSSVVSEIDHTGHWFDPLQGGWGFTLTEQGDTLGSVLYAYDTAGAPTWIAGFDRGKGAKVDFFATSGSCPSCAYQPIALRSVGSVTFDYQGERELILRPALTVALAEGVRLDGARAMQLGRPASTRAADRQLASLDNDAALKSFLDSGMLSIPTGSGGIDFSAAPPMTAYSPTNLQEQNVDEGGLVKTDGHYVYTFEYADGARKAAVRFAEIGAGGASLVVKGSVALQGAQGAPLNFAGLFQQSARVVAVTGSQPYAHSDPWLSSSAWIRGVTHIEVLDTSVPAAPVTRWRARIDGHVLSTRRIGDRLYVVSRFVPDVEGFSYGATYESAIAANRQRLAATPLAAMLPKVSVNGGEATIAVDPRSVYVPPVGARKPLADMILVIAVDLAEPRIAQVIAVAGSAEAVYVSGENLYVATSRFDLRTSFGAFQPWDPYFYLTDLHQIRLGAQAMSIAASGTVEGHLGENPDKAAFRLSEHQGRLRAVTSSGAMWGGSIANRLTILEPSSLAPGLLKTLSWIPNERRPEPLGKPNEALHATRFVGDRLYAVTFRRIDPLYVVELGEPSDPKITGALEVPGFSEYLHPLSGSMLLGFGQDADASGNVGGLQLSLYDVSAAGPPREVQRLALGKRGSQSALMHHHHAFSALLQGDGTGTIAFPARIHEGTPSYGAYPWFFSGVLRFQLQGAGSGMRLAPLPFVISHHMQSSSPNFNDPATHSGRSILLPNGTVYVGNGRFWRQDPTGETFGPL